jgi:hypothetical protein
MRHINRPHRKHPRNIQILLIDLIIRPQGIEMELRGAQIRTLDPFEDIEHEGRFILVRDEDFLVVGDFAEVAVINKCTTAI